MTDTTTASAPGLSEADILSVYEELGLTAAADRAYFAAFDPSVRPTTHLVVRIGTTSAPQA